MAGSAPVNAKDSMKSTWRTADKKTWNRQQRMMELVNIHPTSLDQKIPVHKKTDKVPYLPQWQTHLWVLIHALWPMAAHQLYCNVLGHNFHPVVAFGYYTFAYHVNAIHELQMLRKLGHTYGFLDGDKHERDQLPDHSVTRTFHALATTATFRPLMAVMLSWRNSQQPKDMSWWVPVEIGLYGIVLDFWFYWYHRAMHEIDGLWKFHRTHHLTKHPTPLLTLYADHEQEIFDIAVIPFMTWGTLKLMGLPMGFYDSWICHQYIVWTELYGHSGVRTLTNPPSTNNWFLRLFDAELATEDHDLHHRKGYRKSMNYGKQTLLWDKLFGTAGERVESTKANIDYENTAVMPFFPILDDIVYWLEKGKVKP